MSAAVAYRTGISSADATTTIAAPPVDAGAVAIPALKTSGAPGISVGVRFSAAAATVKITVLCYNRDTSPTGSGTLTLLGMLTEVTITATAKTDAAGKYLGAIYAYDANGSARFPATGSEVTDVYVLVSGAPSSGSVDLWSWAY